MPRTYYFLTLVLVSSAIPPAWTSVSSMIFKKITSSAACVRLTNATHQIGCASGFSGSRGTVQLVSDMMDLQWILADGPHDPYIAMLHLTEFNGTVLARLKKSSRVNGVLVIATGTSANVSDGFSPDLSCPNKEFGLPSSVTDCHWNSIYGNSLAYESFPFPVFAIRKNGDAQALMECYNKHNNRVNGNAPQFPLCSAEMKDFMYAVRDTYTCMRQSEVSASFSGTSVRCDALQGKNVWGMLEARDRTAGDYTDRSVIMVITRLDASSFFHDISPGAETSTTGLVTLLAVMDAIGRAKKQFGNRSPVDKPLVFAVFNGESFDYIGSSRMVWEMKEKTFPPNPPSDKKQQFPASLKLSQIQIIVELSQAGLSDLSGSMFMHFDSHASSTFSVRQTLEQHALQQDLNLANGSGHLPPASVQQFLAEDKDIKGVVLADHDDQYKNRYYNSFLDDADNLVGMSKADPATSSTTMQITKLATTVARTLYELAGRKPEAMEVSDLTANSTYVHELLRCFTLNFTCPQIREVLSKSSVGKIANSTGANPRYIGPSSPANQQVVVAVAAFLAQAIGVKKNVTEEDACSNSTDSLNSYFWMQAQYSSGENLDNRGQCIVAPVLQHTALSPAFDMKDYKSTKYSTWAESRWKSYTLRIYLAPASKSQHVTFAVGWVVLLLSFLIAFHMNRVSSALFAST